MKRGCFYLLVLIAIAFVFFVLPAKFARSQTTTPAPSDFNFDRALQDYSYNVDLYTKAFNDYLAARAKYISIGTLATGDDARIATIAMLQARDSVVATYLTTLRMKLKDSIGVSDSEKDSYYTRIDAEVAWYADHKDHIPSAQTLADLVADSNESKTHYAQTKYTTYATLLVMTKGKVDHYHDELTKNVSDLKDKIAEIHQKGDMDTLTVEYAMVDINNKVTRSEDKEAAAKDVVSSMTVANAEISYKNALTGFQESFFYLKDANSAALEVIRQIKTQN